MTKLIYSPCLAAEKGCFFVNGDEVLTLEEIAHSLQKAAVNLLAQHSKTPYKSFVISSSTASNIPKIDDMRLTRFFKSIHSEDNPHQPISFAVSAKDMVTASWNHR